MFRIHSILTPLVPADAASRRRFLGRASAVAIGAALTACGGGGGGGTDTTPPTGGSAASFTSGAITGFGSIIVNGVRFDDSAASVVDDSGRAISRDDLRLGAQVEIDGGRINRATGRATAMTIRVSSEIKGPVSAVDLAAGRLTVLGQTVVVDARTVFDDQLAAGLADVTVDMLVEVHAQYDAANAVYVASRIEQASASSTYKLRGVVAELDSASTTFRIGDAVINYAAITTVPASLKNGAFIRVQVQAVPVAGQWVATALDNGQRRHGEDRDEAEFKGYITDWTSATAFSVDGLPVDASAASFPDGESGVVLGAFVEVEGSLVGGVLQATKVQVEDRDGEDHSEDYELHGELSGLDSVAKTFQLRGVLVSYAEVSQWKDLGEADLRDGLVVEVKGQLDSNGTVLLASRISLDD